MRRRDPPRSGRRRGSRPRPHRPGSARLTNSRLERSRRGRRRRGCRAEEAGPRLPCTTLFAETTMPNARTRTRVARPLLRWYDRAKRDLPWRRDPTPYKTLVSELMLQQTGVVTVEPYFKRFVERFPTLQALGSATDDQVTALWSGLGYYARARNLRRAAAVVVAEHGGELPRTEEALRTLPGVGPYTAAAVGAIAFGLRTLALDG